MLFLILSLRVLLLQPWRLAATGRAGLGWWQPCFAVMAPFTSCPGAILWSPSSPAGRTWLFLFAQCLLFYKRPDQGNSPLPFFPSWPSVLLSSFCRCGMPGMVTQSNFLRAWVWGCPC